MAEAVLMASDPKTRTQRVHGDIIAMIRVIEAAAEHTGEKFKAVEFIDGLIRPAVTEKYRKALAVLNKLAKRDSGNGH